MDDAPSDPMTMAGLAVATHELYSSYRKAGFDHRAGLYLAAVAMGNPPLIAPDSIENDPPQD